jgi:hypothetical protein
VILQLLGITDNNRFPWPGCYSLQLNDLVGDWNGLYEIGGLRRRRTIEGVSGHC